MRRISLSQPSMLEGPIWKGLITFANMNIARSSTSRSTMTI